MPTSPAPRKLEQEERESETTVGYIANLSFA